MPARAALPAVLQGIIVGNASGRLEIVATPIGNLADLSARARSSLENATLVAAEDTRRTQALLSALGISRPLVSLHLHNESARVAELISRLQAGATIALVSDAGTPVLSDPGYELVRAAIDAGLEVRPIPGASAIITALAASGLPADRFCFEGFLPTRTNERRARLDALAAETRTLVFFEAPHRIGASLADLALSFGEERQAVIGRELTKTFETFYRDTLGALRERAQADANVRRGEITLVVAGAPPVEAGGVDRELLSRVIAVLSRELAPGKVAALAAQITGATRAEAYSVALQRER